MSAVTEPLTITLADVQALGSVDEALQTFFDDAVATVAAQTSVGERAIREWVENELISDQGFRTQALEGPPGSGTAVLVAMENCHVVRSDSRRGAQWYELSHDRLVAPIRAANAAWRTANLAPFQLDAMAWDHQGRPEGMLAGGEALQAASEWAKANPAALAPVDREFLEVSTAHERDLLVGARSTRRIRVLAALALGLAVIALFGGVIAYSRSRESGELREARRLAEANASTAKEQQSIAERNAAEAGRLLDLANTSAAEADAQRLLAEESADEAARQQRAAEASAAEAARQQALAEASAAEAEVQRQLAEQNAAAADLSAADAKQQRDRAEASAAEARRQQRRAEAAAADAEVQRRLAEASEAEAVRQKQLAEDLSKALQTYSRCVYALAFKQSSGTGAKITEYLNTNDEQKLRDLAYLLTISIPATYDPDMNCSKPSAS